MRRGVSTIVGAIIAIPIFIALILVAMQYATLAEEAAKSINLRIAASPEVVNGTVYLTLSSTHLAVIDYIVVWNLTNGDIIIVEGPWVVQPGKTLFLPIFNATAGKYDIAIVTSNGILRPVQGSFVLELPGESDQQNFISNLINNYLLDYLGVDCTNIIKINVSMDAARYSIKVTASTNSPTGYNYYYVIDFYIDRRLVKRIEYRGVTAIPPNSRVFQYFKVINNTYIYGKVEYRSGSLVLAAEAGLYINNTIFVANKRSSIYGLEPILNVNVYGIYLYENYYPVTQDVHEIPADYNLRNYGTVAVEVPVHAEALVCS